MDEEDTSEINQTSQLDTFDMGHNIYTIEQIVERLKDGEESKLLKIRRHQSQFRLPAEDDVERGEPER
jgi:hypothetical protein